MTTSTKRPFCCYVIFVAVLLQGILRGIADADPDLPKFFEQPVSKSVAVGGPAQWNPVVSSPLGTPAFQWFFNGQPIENATNAMLTISESRRVDSGWYTLKARNEAGQSASEAAFLTVTGSPSGTVLFRNIDNTPATRIVFFDGTPVTGMNAQLFAGPQPDQLVAHGAPVLVTQGYFIGPRISIPSVAPGQTAYIQARLSTGQVSNLIPVQAGNASVGGTLEAIRFPAFIEWPTPIFLTQPLDQEVALGSPLELELTILDYSRVTVKWIKDGNPTAVLTNILELSGFNNQGTARMAIPVTSLSDAGSYKATIEQGSGYHLAMSESANVDVLIPAHGSLTGIQRSGSQWQLTARGRANRTYSLQRKTELLDWTTLQVQRSPDGEMAFNYPVELNLFGWFRLSSE